MSALPPDVVGSSLQAGFVQREAARHADAARTGQVQATERHLRAMDEAASNVETTDNDVQIYADAEGAGGQGRNFREASQETTEEGPDTAGSPPGATEPRHLDIQA